VSTVRARARARVCVCGGGGVTRGGVRSCVRMCADVCGGEQRTKFAGATRPRIWAGHVWAGHVWAARVTGRTSFSPGVLVGIRFVYVGYMVTWIHHVK